MSRRLSRPLDTPTRRGRRKPEYSKLHDPLQESILGIELDASHGYQILAKSAPSVTAKRKIISYSPELGEQAMKLRENMTFAEVPLQKQLRAKKMLRYDFDRQRPIDRYIVNFF